MMVLALFDDVISKQYPNENNCYFTPFWRRNWDQNGAGDGTSASDTTVNDYRWVTAAAAAAADSLAPQILE